MEYMNADDSQMLDHPSISSLARAIYQHTEMHAIAHVHVLGLSMLAESNELNGNG